jgi:uncharacterized protein YyaL (SSP411 family)
MHHRDCHTGKRNRTRTVTTIGVFVAPEVRMTIEEYEEMVSAIRGGLAVARKTRPRKAKTTKRAGKKDPKMARALKKANAMMRTKSGKLRKGKSQADVMRKAHQLRRKM